jgi:hypothetical protein
MIEDMHCLAPGTEIEPENGAVPAKEPLGATRTLSENALHLMSNDEYVVGQRIHDSLLRTLEIMGQTISLESTYVHYKNGILTVDLLTNPQTRRRMILGPEGRVTFMDYSVRSGYGRKITVPPHFSSNAVERNLESILLQTRNFAVDAQQQIS